MSQYVFPERHCTSSSYYGGESFRLSEEKTRQKGSVNHLLHSCKKVSCVPGDALRKYPFWLDCTYHCSVTLLVVFPHNFSDSVDILLPRQCKLSQPIMFGVVVTNVTPKIYCACAHPKSVTCPEHFSCLGILRGVQSGHNWSDRCDTLIPGPGVSANQNRSQVLLTYLKLRCRQHTRAV